MPSLEVPRPTVRTLRTDAVAYVDPHFPVDQLWSPLAEPVHAVERGEDVELTGELVLVGEETVFTGHRVQGRHATYRFTGDELTGMSLLAEGAQPVGAVRGTFCTPDAATVSVTTREGSGTSVVQVPVGEDVTVPVDVLVDSRHQPCGYIINGDLDLASWESRILPGETGRVSSQELLAALRSVLPQNRPAVVSRTSGFLGRAKTTVLGHVGELDMGRAWEFPVRSARDGLTATELIELLADPVFRVGPDLGVEVSGGDPAWMTEIRREGDTLHLVVADVVLPDKPL